MKKSRLKRRDEKMIPKTKEIFLKNVHDGNKLVGYVAAKLHIDESEVW